MLDTEYLQEIVDYYIKLDELTNLIPIAIYNGDNKLVFSSNEYNKIRKDSNNGMPVNKGFYTQEQSINEQNEVIASKVRKHSVNFNQFNNELEPYIASKTPLINKYNGNTIGVRVVLQNLFYTNIKFSILNSFKIYNLPENKTIYQKFKLTKREKQVIFLFLSGLTSQEIANVLSKIDNKVISKNAIDAVFTNQLRLKFEVYSREGLYQKLINLGFYNMVPKDLMTYIKLETEEVYIY